MLFDGTVVSISTASLQNQEHTKIITSAANPGDFILEFYASDGNDGANFRELSLREIVPTIDAEVLHISGNVGIGTSQTHIIPQHSLDIPDMGGLILGYTMNTGSADGSGKEILLAVPQTSIGDQTLRGLTGVDWGVIQDSGFQTVITDGVETGDGSNYLGLTYTMPASGRALVSVPHSLWRCHDDTTFTQIGDGDAGWFPEHADLLTAMTRSG